MENVLLNLFVPPRDAPQRGPVVLDGVPDSLRLLRDVTRSSRVAAEDQEDEDVVQAPPTEDHEVVLQHQPEPRREGPQTTGAENWALEKGFTGKIKALDSEYRSPFVILMAKNRL